jgi:tRNA-splicing ligase RtcB
MNKPIRIFAETVDGAALDQFYSAMKLDCAVQGALMPDAHAGYTLPIGAVVATDGMIFPSFVGYDLGCGMSALPVPVSVEAARAAAQAIFDAILRLVPVGFSVNQKSRVPLTQTELDTSDLTAEARVIAESADNRNWWRARGSLGGGNHFIEVGADETGQVWVIIHSGSRGVGHGIAMHYMKLASPDGRPREGLYGLRAESLAGQAYRNDLRWALQFALENRLEMMYRVVRAIETVAGLSAATDWRQLINRNHNHAELKDGRWIHRKGATHAETGMLGVIPGNMRDGSFIVRGKGNPESLCSSSHGAGRVLGRKQAAQTLKLGDFERTMREAAVVARVDAGTLDESPFAYKDIFSVMAQQEDLVEVLHHVRPIINVKG